MTDQTITLKDGRTLAYTEHGAPDGKPVIFIHGNPGSRLMRHPNESIVENLGVRVITPDRPGYGLSDFQPRRTLLDFPDDIAQLADRLGIAQFHIFGVSAGGPYTAACAYKLGDRIPAAAIVSGAAPMDREGAYDGMSSEWQAAFKMSAWPKWLLKPLLRMRANADRKDPEKAVENTAAIVSENDRKILQDPAIRAGVKARTPEATRQGVDGWAHEVKVITAPWGFPLEEISIPIHLWYWADDPAIPPQMGRYLEDKILSSIPHFEEGGGHLSLFEHWEKIIKTLIETG